MHIVLWVLQGLLAAAFLGAGIMKLVQSKAWMIEKFGDWVEAMPGPSIRIIGLLEVAGALGMILPMALEVVMILTPIAAIGFVLTMIGAIILHIQRKETDKLPPNVVLMLLAATVVVGRLILEPVI